MKKCCNVLIGVFIVLTWCVVCNSNSLAAGKPIIIKYGHQLPEAEAVAKQARVFAKCMKEKSNGNVEVEVYPAAQLFTARDAFAMVRKGAVDIAAVGSPSIQESIPFMEIFDVPFLFQTYDQVKGAWYGYPGDVLRTEFDKQGVTFIAEGYYGFIQLSNSKREIRSPKDLQGLKIRTVGPLSAELARIMGAAAIVLGGDEAYLAMARKVVDGSLTGAASMSARKYWEVQKYVTLTSMGYIGLPLFINSKYMNGLPIEVQGLVKECAKISEDFVLKDTIRDEQDSIVNLAKHGIIVYKPTPEELGEFRKVCLPIKEAWIKKQGEIGAKMVKFVENIIMIIEIPDLTTA